MEPITLFVIYISGIIVGGGDSDITPTEKKNETKSH